MDWDLLALRLGVADGVSYCRWLIDCARYGSATRQDVTNAVRQARRDWLRGLFPEVEFSG